MSNKFTLSAALLLISLSSVGQVTDKTDYTPYYKDLPFEMEAMGVPDFPSLSVSIDLFCKQDGQNLLCADAIQQAIDSVYKQGGGTVYIPKGVWNSDPFELKSNVRLFTEEGTVVVFTKDYDRFPLVETYYEGKLGWRVMSPIYAKDATHIAIEGKGVFDGNGQAWRPVKQDGVDKYLWREFLASGGVLNENGSTWYPTQRALKGASSRIPINQLSFAECMAIKEYLRPVMINLFGCQEVYIKGVTFRNSPAWCLHPVLCKKVILDEVTLLNEPYAANGDALDLESCSNVLIKDCVLDAGDDAICMKSGKDEEGRRRGVPTERVVIDGCKVYNGHGGFVIGSEMSGGVRNIQISNCSFIATDNGLRFKSTRGRGGVVENIWINNIQMANIKGNAILFDLYYFAKGNREVKPVDESTPQFKNIFMEDIYCCGSGRVGIMQGLPEMKLNNVSLKNAVITGTQPLSMTDTKDIWFENVTMMSAQDTLTVKKRTEMSYLDQSEFTAKLK